MVADEHLVALVICQTDAAVRARIGRAALGAGDDLARAAPVEKQDALLAAAQILLQLAVEHGADGAGIAAAQFLLHVGNNNIRQLAGVEPVRQREVMIAAGLGVITADDVRRRRAKQQQRIVLGAAELGHIARVVARRALGLIRVLLLLVDDEQTEILHRCKYRAARADDDARKTRADALPLVIALRERQTAVQDGDRVTEISRKRLDHLRRQRDLRHEQDRALPRCERLRDQVQVDKRLAAAGHAEEQRRLRIRRAQQCLQAGKHLLLRRRQRRDRLRLPDVVHRAAKIGLGVNTHDALLHERFHGASRRTGELAHFVGRRAADRAQQLKDGDLMLCTSAAADLLLRLFQRDGKAGILQLLIAHDARFRALHGQKFLLHEPVQSARRVFIAKRRLQLVERTAAAVCQHRLQRQTALLGFPALRQCRSRVQLRRRTIDRADPVPDAGRQDRVQRIVDRAEKAVMHPDGQAQQLLRKDGLGVELARDGLELRVILRLTHRKHHALARAVPARKRHHDAAAGAKRIRQRLRDLIRIRSIERKCCSQNGDFCDRDLQHLRAPSPKKSGGYCPPESDYSLCTT